MVLIAAGFLTRGNEQSLVATTATIDRWNEAGSLAILRYHYESDVDRPGESVHGGGSLEIPVKLDRGQSEWKVGDVLTIYVPQGLPHEARLAPPSM